MLSFLKARAAPAPSAGGGAQRHIVLTAPGRSGSTLLQSFFLADCEAVTFFEPCRFTPEVGGEESLVRERCIAQVRRFLACDLPAAEGPAGAQRWDPPELKGWLRHPYRASNASCALNASLASVNETRRACRAAPLVLVKEIRLVGQLRALASAWPAGDASAAALSVVHLVRDPRSMLASQKKLGWWRLREGTPAARLKNLEYIANRTCVGMLADADAGAELAKQRGAAAYVRVRFEDLLADIKGAAAALSRQLGLPVAPAAAEWLERFTQGDCDSHTPRPGMTPEQAYQYGTCRDPVAAQRAVAGKSWKHGLNPREKRTILARCDGVLRRFGYLEDQAKAKAKKRLGGGVWVKWSANPVVLT